MDLTLVRERLAEIGDQIVHWARPAGWGESPLSVRNNAVSPL